MPKNLPLSLFIMRITIALFLLPWVIDKFTVGGVEHTQRIFSHFYKFEGLTQTMSYGIGIFWAVLLLAFVTGFKKPISYGLVMIFHGMSTLVTVKNMIPGTESFRMLFLAAIPVLGAMIALFLLRQNDTIMTIDS